MFTETYYVHIHGEQKGPYTFLELKRLYEQSFFPAETLYWQDGMDQWLPVSELCGPTLRERKKRSRSRLLVLLGVVLVCALALALISPILIDGWKEASQHEFTDAAAYWKAREFVRGELKKQNATVSFEPGQVTMGANTAEVTLPCIVFPSGAGSRRAKWRATMRFDPAQRQWSGVVAGEIKAGP